MLTFDDYQTQTEETNIYSAKISELLQPIYSFLVEYDGSTEALKALIKVEKTLNLVYVTLGLAGEAAEVANKVKKLIRDGELPDGTEKELGDLEWYCAQFASQRNASLGDIAQGNLDKLFSRKERNVLQGDGDNR